MVGYNQDAVNTLLRLLTRGKDEAAYKVFLTMQASVRADNNPTMSGHILIKHLVKLNRVSVFVITTLELAFVKCVLEKLYWNLKYFFWCG